MQNSTREEIRIGQIAIRFLVEGPESGGSVAVFEFDVPAGAKVPVAHSHDAYFREIAAVMHAAAGGPPNPAALAEVMRRHGLTPAP